MSKFAKRKNKAVQTYEKCPSIQLFSVAHFMNNFTYINADINHVYLVEDSVRKIAVKDNSIYLTTGLLLGFIDKTYEISVRYDENGNRLTKPLTYIKDVNGKVKEETYSSYSHYHYSSDTYGCNVPLSILDLVFYMRERGKISIKASEKVTTFSNNRTGYTIKPNSKLKTVIKSAPFISERLEFTKIMNELLALHKGNNKVSNSIRYECKSKADVPKLISRFGKKKIVGVTPMTNEAIVNKSNSICKITNLFLELGGLNHVSE
tara:strand:+ start:2808 stop:3596 length:789 start_codon:yes stop_codon:yes gene_type:complete